MGTTFISPALPVTITAPEELCGDWRALVGDRRIDRIALALGLCTVPLSVVVAETFLGVALTARVVSLARRRVALHLPRIFWFWIVWAGLEIFRWALSPDLKVGWSEIRHLLVIAAMFLMLPALDRAPDARTVWQGVFLSSTLSALFLIGEFVARLVYYRREIAVTADPSLYLRTAGLLNHWMVFGTVEIIIVAGLINFWHLYPQSRHRWLPVYLIHGLAIVLSLTRMTWVACFLLLAIFLAGKRSKWLWLLPALPLALYLLAPAVIQSRVRESVKPTHYSNFERIQMLKVGWEMFREHPLAGVGPGRVGALYRSYLASDDPVPAWHDHLHNNLAQIGAQFGAPALVAALLFTIVLFQQLLPAWKSAATRESRFLAGTGLLALVGFVIAGMSDYTYGHSLALILLSFAAFTPLIPLHRDLVN